MPKPDHEPRTWCPQCGAVCATETAEGQITFRHIKEPTIGTYTEDEIVKVFAERKRFCKALEDLRIQIHDGADESALLRTIDAAFVPEA